MDLSEIVDNLAEDIRKGRTVLTKDARMYSKELANYAISRRDSEVYTFLVDNGVINQEDYSTHEILYKVAQ